MSDKLAGRIGQFLGRFKDSFVFLGRQRDTIVEFIIRIAFVNEEKEARDIENIKSYLEMVDNQIEIYKKSGATQKDIIELTNSLKIPILQANLEAMILRRSITTEKFILHSNPGVIDNQENNENLKAKTDD